MPKNALLPVFPDTGWAISIEWVGIHDLKADLREYSKFFKTP